MPNLFRFENITYKLGNSGRSIIATAGLHEGGVLAVKGPSGSGKSTLLKILAKLLACEDGEVIFQGRNWLSFSPQEWRININYVSQKPAVFNGTVLDNLRIPYDIKARKSAKFPSDKALDGMEQLLLGTGMLEQDARTLSGGEAARMSLLRSVLAEPKVLLLDEPTSALDEYSRAATMLFLKNWLGQQKERGIILVSHLDDVGEFSDLKILELEGKGGSTT